MRAAAIALCCGVLATSPSRAAAAPGHAEPMQTDLVRGLGPEAGELEGNVLGTAAIAGAEHGVHWAPEIEWAPARDVAIELELPLHDTHLEAVKLSTQLTLARAHGRRPAHGLQVVASLPLVRDPSFRLLHVMQAVLGRRFDLVTMLGPKLAVPTTAHPPRVGVLVEAGLFAALPHGHAIGLETSWSGYARHGALDVLPQLHVELGRRARLQVGLGARYSPGLGWSAIAGARMIVQRAPAPAQR